MSVRKIALSVLTVGIVGSFLALDAQMPSDGKQPDNKAVVAVVNGVPITRQQLADELIARKGRAQLEALVHRTLIEQTCKDKGINVSEKEVQEELISEMKASASANLADFEKSMLKPKRTSLFEYREDVIRPRIMIDKLAASQLTLTDEDLKREFACHYGPKVAIRIITFKDAQIAKRTWGEIRGNAQMFIRYAKQQENLDLAASAGMMVPFGRHTTHDEIEKRAFELKDGEISEVIQTPQRGYVIILKDHEYPARTDVTLEQKKEELRASAMEKKRQTKVPEIIAEIKKQASTKIQLFLDSQEDPAKAIEMYNKMTNNPSK
ncbi:MAG TPA: peptidylprolyl isomerase [Gemmatales bacterium]|nr:peptidylprolyl isomerase [Gemmatales bacterium]